MRNYHLPKFKIYLIKFKRFLTFHKKQLTELSDKERDALYQEQAKYIFNLRTKYENKVEELDFKTNSNSDNPLNQVNRYVIKVKFNHFKKKCESRNNQIEFYVKSLKEKADKEISKLTEKTIKDIDYKKSDEYRKELEKREVNLIKKINKNKATDKIKGFEIGDDSNETLVIKEKGYRKSQKLVIENINLANAEIDKFLLDIQNSKNSSPEQQRKSEQKLIELTEKINSYKNDIDNTSKSFKTKSWLESNSDNDYSFSIESINKQSTKTEKSIDDFVSEALSESE